MIEVRDETPLKWPEGWGRTLIEHRKSRGAWKKQLSVYRTAVLKELELIGASAATITYNEPSKQRVDPGVTVWFSLKAPDNFSWQSGLHLDNPAPTKQEIDAAFRRLSAKHHPDAVANGSGGDLKIFYRLSEYKTQALRWIAGESAFALDSCVPFDGYVEVRQNLAAIKLILAHFRGLKRLGMPTILERVMERTFRNALPAQADKDKKEEVHA